MLFDLPAAATPDFTHFVTDTGQDEALRLAQEVAAGMSSAYLWGPVGTGKTHLLNACRNAVNASGRPVAKLNEPRPAQGLLLCDDVDTLDETGQEMLFSNLKRLTENTALQLLATGAQPPTKMHNLRADVCSRLAALPCIPLRPLSDSGRQTALLSYARRCDRPLDIKVARVLVECLPRDMGFLVQAFELLDAYALSSNTVLTAASTSAWLRDQRYI